LKPLVPAPYSYPAVNTSNSYNVMMKEHSGFDRNSPTQPSSLLGCNAVSMGMQFLIVWRTAVLSSVEPVRQFIKDSHMGQQ